MKKKIAAALLGLSVADAIGVPAEFKSRKYLQQNPVTGITGFSSHNVPPGTFSDDSSLAFCLAEALTKGFDLKTIAANFVAWRYNNYWTPFGTVFDIGFATSEAIERLANGTPPELAGGFSEYENGNGSLMRILPLLFYIRNKPIEDRFITAKFVSSITHGHTRSVVACFYYLEYARLILNGEEKLSSYQSVKKTVTQYLYSTRINPAEIALFNRLLADDIYTLNEDAIKSSGYVLHTLEAAIWCFLTTNSYEEAVLKAVNLGDDTDTTATVTGGLAALLYGIEGIPQTWLDALVRREDIEDLAERLAGAAANY